MTDEEKEGVRSELRYAAIAFSNILEDAYDMDNYVNAVTRLEVAAKAFSDSRRLEDAGKLHGQRKTRPVISRAGEPLHYETSKQPEVKSGLPGVKC